MSTNNIEIKEALSALMDGEASALEVRRLLKIIPADDTLRDSWRRHQISAAIMHQELSSQVIDFSVAINAAIASEKSYRPAALVNHFIKPLGRFAVAASVAAAVLISVQQDNHSAITPQSFAAKDNIQLNLATSNLRTATEFGIPPISARTVSTSSTSKNLHDFPSKVTLQSTNTGDELTREQVQRYLNSLLDHYQKTEDMAIN
ncbi:MAG: sigma-E factor negative regulatory protein RseA [Porticoccus sp.]|jgi:sigma-E factor negative regulatory protein RseA